MELRDYQYRIIEQMMIGRHVIEIHPLSMGKSYYIHLCPMCKMQPMIQGANFETFCYSIDGVTSTHGDGSTLPKCSELKMRRALE